MLGLLDFLRRLGTGGCRHGHTMSDAAWDIEFVRPWAVDSGLMW
jgi:hypothetical protein